VQEIIQNVHGVLIDQHCYVSLTFFVLVLLLLGFTGAPFILWSVLFLAAALGFGAPPGILIALVVIALIGVIRPLRANLISRFVLGLLKKFEFLPKISDTERAAIEAGAVWMEGELFSGKPNFYKLLSQPYPKLTADERAFLDGPVNRLCAMIDDWKIWQERKLPDEVWNFIRREKFLGMIIPKEYGGLGFSATAHSEVIRKIASRSGAVATYVMVPNSLGPAELLVHYGTAEQKKEFLPRLANGDEIPCFALTEPLAGSDAGSISAEGVLFKGPGGQLQLRLNWNKRWITLASISTVLGLAFRLKDPENLLGRGKDLGITCAIIPSSTPGVVLGRRHDPLGVPFYNCPTQGHDVVVPASAIFGGIDNAGKGWKMLMESLAAGRGVSFPAQSVGGAQLVTRVVTAHALIRQQFGVSIGYFEGVQEPISKIIGFNYILESLRNYTLSALDQGIKPAVVTAISKYYSSELARSIINHGMDIMGGSGISLGPKNLLGHMYIATPIAITVEGANILTRSLIIFGQGALRAHPFAYAEVEACEAGDLRGFDRAFWGHIGHIVRNAFRSVLLSVTRGWLSFPWPRMGSTGVYYRKLAWTSASFAILADIAMGTLGGKLKAKEHLSGRFADILAYMYIGTAVLRRFEAEGAKKEDLPLVHFSMSFIFGEIQRAFDGIFANLAVPGLTWFFRGPLRNWSKFSSLGGETSDAHVRKIAELALTDIGQRDHLTRDMYMPENASEHLAQLEQAVEAYRRAQGAEKKLKTALREKRLVRKSRAELISDALRAGVLNAADVSCLETWERLREEAIQVDSFTEDEYFHRPLR
jgi:acyl-CoA dehydrogenase